MVGQSLPYGVQTYGSGGSNKSQERVRTPDINDMLNIQVDNPAVIEKHD